MEIKIQSVRFDADKKLLEFIKTKVEKLTQVADNIIDIEVILKIEKSDINENKIVEITVNIPKITGIFAKRSSKTFEESIDLVCDAVRTQLKKQRGRQKE